MLEATRVRYVGVRRRAAAVIIDTLLATILQIPTIVAGARWFRTVLHDVQVGVQPQAFPVNPAFVRFAWAGSLLTYAYFVLMEWRFGATIGKLALGIRVVKLDGAKMDLWESFLRNICRVVDGILFYLVGAIIVWNSALHQRLGDMAARTVVVTVADLRSGLPVAPIPPPPVVSMPPPPAPSL